MSPPSVRWTVTVAARAQELRDRLDAAPMSGAQVAAVAVTVALSALDGYDVLSITFAAPAIASDWGIGKAALGGLLSAGLAGMALGSLVIAPLADIVGRRRLVLGSLALMATGMLLSSFAATLTQLISWRVLTGLGIGSMVAVINPLAAEFANARRRPLALALMAMGYPLGGLVGGLVSAALLRSYGWPAVFGAGFVAACALVPIVLLFLPEPLAFLLAKRRPGSLTRVNALLERYGFAPITGLPPQAAAGAAGYAAVFAPQQIGTTVRVTLANLLVVMTVYYVLSWLPQMVAEAGFPASTASLVGAVANLSGIVGGIAVGVFARHVGLNRLTVAALIGLGVATAAFGSTPASLPLLIAAAAVCGFFLFGGIAGLYATFAVSFTAQARASGTGFAIGIGRIGSAGAPLLAGWLFSAGFGHGAVSVMFGSCAALGGLVLVLPHPIRPARAISDDPARIQDTTCPT